MHSGFSKCTHLCDWERRELIWPITKSPKRHFPGDFQSCEWLSVYKCQYHWGVEKLPPMLHLGQTKERNGGEHCTNCWRFAHCVSFLFKLLLRFSNSLMQILIISTFTSLEGSKWACVCSAAQWRSTIWAIAPKSTPEYSRTILNEIFSEAVWRSMMIVIMLI